jgi:hypothetical protein
VSAAADFVVADSFRLKNRQLLLAAKRCASFQIFRETEIISLANGKGKFEINKKIRY